MILSILSVSPVPLDDSPIGNKAKLAYQAGRAGVDPESTITFLAKARTIFQDLTQLVDSDPSLLSAKARESFLKLSKTLELKSARVEEEVLGACYQIRTCLLQDGRSKECPAMGKIQEIAECIARCKLASDFPKTIADGVMRNAIYYTPPGMILELRSKEKNRKQPELFEVVILGGGPSGVAALHNLGAKGVDTLLLEGGYCIQGMSDARAQSVHTMRTDPLYSSILGAKELGDQDSELRMDKMMGCLPIRATASLAREAITAHTGNVFDARFASGEDLKSPVARAEVFTYFNEVLSRAAAFPNVTISEQNPVNKVDREPDGTFLITTACGDCYRAKKLIVAPGFAGSAAEFGRGLTESKAEKLGTTSGTVVINSEHDIYTKADQIQELQQRLLSGKKQGLIVIGEAVLGHVEAAALIKLQPANTRIAVVGSGETAVKAVLQLHYLNPDIGIDLYVKAPLEPDDAQSPSFYQTGPKLLRSLVDPEFARKTLELKAKFGSPVTFETLKRIIELSQTGNVRVFELGVRFGASDLGLKINDSSGSLNISVPPSSARVLTSLKRQYEEWTALGLKADWLLPILKGENVLSQETQGIILCAGYESFSSRRKKSLDSGLSQVLAFLSDDAGELRLAKDGLTSAKYPNLSYAGAVAMHGYGDGGFYGGGLRATAVARYLSTGENILSEHSKNIPLWRENDQRRFVEWSGLDRKQMPAQARYVNTPGLVALEKRVQAGAQLNPVESLLLARGQALEARMHPHLLNALVETAPFL